MKCDCRWLTAYQDFKTVRDILNQMLDVHLGVNAVVDRTSDPVVDEMAGRRGVSEGVRNGHLPSPARPSTTVQNTPNRQNRFLR